MRRVGIVSFVPPHANIRGRSLFHAARSPAHFTNPFRMEFMLRVCENLAWHHAARPGRIRVQVKPPDGHVMPRPPRPLEGPVGAAGRELLEPARSGAIPCLLPQTPKTTGKARPPGGNRPWSIPHPRMSEWKRSCERHSRKPCRSRSPDDCCIGRSDRDLAMWVAALPSRKQEDRLKGPTVGQFPTVSTRSPWVAAALSLSTTRRSCDGSLRS